MTFLISVLTGLGVGSGGLYILYLTLIKGVGQAEAQGENLAFFITAALAAAIVSIIKKRISFVSLALTLPTGIVGAVAGCYLASVIHTRVLGIMFGILIVCIGAVGFIKLIKKE